MWELRTRWHNLCTRTGPGIILLVFCCSVRPIDNRPIQICISPVFVVFPPISAHGYYRRRSDRQHHAPLSRLLSSAMRLVFRVYFLLLCLSLVSHSPHVALESRCKLTWGAQSTVEPHAKRSIYLLGEIRYSRAILVGNEQNCQVNTKWMKLFQAKLQRGDVDRWVVTMALLTQLLSGVCECVNKADN